MGVVKNEVSCFTNSEGWFLCRSLVRRILVGNVEAIRWNLHFEWNLVDGAISKETNHGLQRRLWYRHGIDSVMTRVPGFECYSEEECISKRVGYGRV